MCGLAASFAYLDSSPPIDRGQLLRIREKMHSRATEDGAGVWIFDDNRVGLAHRRPFVMEGSLIIV